MHVGLLRPLCSQNCSVAVLNTELLSLVYVLWCSRKEAAHLPVACERTASMQQQMDYLKSFLLVQFQLT